MRFEKLPITALVVLVAACRPPASGSWDRCEGVLARSIDDGVTVVEQSLVRTVDTRFRTIEESLLSNGSSLTDRDEAWWDYNGDLLVGQGGTSRDPNGRFAWSEALTYDALGRHVGTESAYDTPWTEHVDVTQFNYDGDSDRETTEYAWRDGNERPYRSEVTLWTDERAVLRVLIDQVRLVAPNLATTHWAYLSPAPSRDHTYHYTQPHWVTDGTRLYDAAGNLEWEERHERSELYGAADREDRYVYDADGRLTEYHFQWSTGAGPTNTGRNTQAYDDAGRLTLSEWFDDQGRRTTQEEYTWSEEGLPLREREATLAEDGAVARETVGTWSWDCLSD